MRTEVAAGRWLVRGRHTVVIGNLEPRGAGRLWQAVWETGGGSALDGAAALVASGLTGFEPTVTDVSVPKRNRSHRVTGVRRHRRTRMPPTGSAGLPRVDVAPAAVSAAAWAASDRQAVLVLCLVLQQRMTTPDRLLAAWHRCPTRMERPRRQLLRAAVGDLCDGVRSLGELDFAGLCRENGLPEPSRQVVRTLPGGRAYLDVEWEGIDLVVEVDGGHHALALAVVDDALRQNEVVLSDDRVLRIPVLGLRLEAERFMLQVVRAHRRWSRGGAA
ncbi:hypothetical protein GCM10023168_09540 [Fodinibacter luteus]|uniref:DUF559 domain-containing protein n=1 Tax=Fodinibacter luteus TaxID=552064 RepID=A0ABP8K6R0_9MICO